MSTELIIITPAELQTATEVFTQNEVWLGQYKTKQAVLLAKALEVGEKLTPELDAEMTKWQVSAKAALKTMKENRMVYTSKMDEFKSKFTAIENEMEKDLYIAIQVKRDASAAIYAREDREAKAKEAQKLAKEQERITLLADAWQQVRAQYTATLEADKMEYFDAFNSATAETIDTVESILKDVDAVFKIDRWHALQPVIVSSLHTQVELDNIIVMAKVGKFDVVAPHYKTEVDGYAAHLLGMIPKRREEIALGAASSAAAELKAKQDAIDAANKKAAADKAALDLAEQQRQAKITSDLNEAKRKAEMTAAPIESYSIAISGKEGWLAIVSMYFQNAEVDLEKFGNVKLDQMRTYAEKLAKSDGIFIEHVEVKYTEKYKAVARATRKSGKETVKV